MDIDEQLLDRNSTDEEQAGELRAARRLNESPETEPGTSLREQVLQARRSEALAISQEKIGASISANPVLKVTDKLLRQAWINLIDSWGLTLIWIDIHAFLHRVFGPTFFRDLGDEWLSGIAKTALGGKTPSEIKISEKAGCLLLNVLLLFVIIAILALVALIYKASAGLLDTIVESLSSLLSGLVDIVRNIF